MEAFAGCTFGSAADLVAGDLDMAHSWCKSVASTQRRHPQKEVHVCVVISYGVGSRGHLPIHSG